MNYNMTEYYKQNLKDGKKFEIFVCETLKQKMNLTIDVYNEIKDQYNIGESVQGFEIKYDKLHKETKNLYIEVAEKSNVKNINFIKSGIFRKDNSWIYIIGNYEVIYFFGINTLKLLYNSKRFKFVGNKTSKGFLLTQKNIQKYCEKKIIINK